MKEWHIALMFRVILFLVFAVVGPFLEWAYGTFWSIIGNTPWVYPNSPMQYTSFEGIPLWGLAGLIAFSIYSAILDRKVKRLRGVIIPLALAILWILIYARFIA